jgi:hypothetical protein
MLEWMVLIFVFRFACGYGSYYFHTGLYLEMLGGMSNDNAVSILSRIWPAAYINKSATVFSLHKPSLPRQYCAPTLMYGFLTSYIKWK